MMPTFPTAFHTGIEELPSRKAKLSATEWTFGRRFRVYTRYDIAPIGPILAITCPGIPAYYSSYEDFTTGETVPNALMTEYIPEPQPNPREWIIECSYTTNLPRPNNGGGLNSPNSPSHPSGGSSNPDDPTQLLPKLSKSVEVLKVPYKFDPQDDAHFVDATGSILGGGFSFSRYCNTAGENFAAGAVIEIPLPVFNVSIYYADDADVTIHSNSVNDATWSGKPACSWLCKPWTTSREKFANNWYWLRNYSFVLDTIFYHRFTVLNAGFRQLENPVAFNNNISVRKLVDIYTGTPLARTSVEWPLGSTGQIITDPGRDGSNLVYARFNRTRKSNFSTIGSPAPFTLNQTGWFTV